MSFIHRCINSARLSSAVNRRCSNVPQPSNTILPSSSLSQGPQSTLSLCGFHRRVGWRNNCIKESRRWWIKDIKISLSEEIQTKSGLGKYNRNVLFINTHTFTLSLPPIIDCGSFFYSIKPFSIFSLSLNKSVCTHIQKDHFVETVISPTFHAQNMSIHQCCLSPTHNL